MSKLFKLKEFLSLKDAASHISNVLGEPVTIADLYRFALDGDLTLSVYFITGFGVKGKWIKESNIQNGFDMYDFETKQTIENTSKNPKANEMHVSGDDWIAWDSGIDAANGVWDLSMKGCEAHDVKYNYEKLASGLEIVLYGYKGILLKQGDIACQLYKPFESDKYDVKDLYNQVHNPPKEKIKKVKDHLSSRTFHIPPSVEGLEHNHYRHFNQIRRCELGFYYVPCSKLFEVDFVFVLRTSEITRFIQSLEDTPQEAKPLHDKERTKFLLLLGSILKKANFDLNERGIAGKIRRATELNNTPVSEQSIRDLLPSLRDIIELKQK